MMSDPSLGIIIAVGVVAIWAVSSVVRRVLWHLFAIRRLIATAFMASTILLPAGVSTMHDLLALARTSAAVGVEGESCLALAPTPGKDAFETVVERVVDGDTVKLASGETLRLVGVNTPETKDPQRGAQPYGPEAYVLSRDLLEGETIIVELGRTPRDHHGRLLGWIWLKDGTWVNGYLVEQGIAQVYTFSDNPDHADLLRLCESQARKAGRGLWALEVYKSGIRAADMR